VGVQVPLSAPSLSVTWSPSGNGWPLFRAAPLTAAKLHESNLHLAKATPGLPSAAAIELAREILETARGLRAVVGAGGDGVVCQPRAAAAPAGLAAVRVDISDTAAVEHLDLQSLPYKWKQRPCPASLHPDRNRVARRQKRSLFMVLSLVIPQFPFDPRLLK
jgi:hypothetical protein